MSDDHPFAAFGDQPDAERLAALRRLSWILYGLYALSYFVGITAIVAVILNYLKREETRGTLYWSHFRWQIRTFWWSLLWMFVAFITLPFGVGILVAGATTIWGIYRIVKGIVWLNDNKRMYREDPDGIPAEEQP